MKGFFNYDGTLNRGLSKIMYLVSLNLLFLLTSIPIVTIGASVSALYTVLFRYIDDGDPAIIRTYFKAFRDNFKKSECIWLILLAAGAVLALDGKVLSAMTGSSAASILIPLLVVLLLAGMAVLVYIFAAAAYFENSIRGYLIYSMSLALARLPQTALLVLLGLIPVIFLLCAASSTGILLPVFLCCGVSLPVYLSAKILLNLFKRTSGEEEVCR